MPPPFLGAFLQFLYHSTTPKDGTVFVMECREAYRPHRSAALPYSKKGGAVFYRKSNTIRPFSERIIPYKKETWGMK